MVINEPFIFHVPLVLGLDGGILLTLLPFIIRLYMPFIVQIHCLREQVDTEGFG